MVGFVDAGDDRGAGGDVDDRAKEVGATVGKLELRLIDLFVFGFVDDLLGIG